MADKAHRLTDEKLAEMEVHLTKIYSRAYDELRIRWNEVLRPLDEEIEKYRRQIDAAENNAGAAVEAPDTGSIESGEWTVNIDQFRPDGTNLYKGLSGTHTSGGISSATKIDTSTLEVDAVAGTTGYLPTKAIAVKPFTRYAIPSNWNGSLLAFGSSGSKSGFIAPTAANGYKYFQTGIRQYYVVFDHHTGSYTDYANFWIKEMGEGVGYN